MPFPRWATMARKSENYFILRDTGLNLKYVLGYFLC